MVMEGTCFREGQVRGVIGLVPLVHTGAGWSWGQGGVKSLTRGVHGCPFV